MRTYEKIYKDFCNYLVKKTGNLDYEYDRFLEIHGEQEGKAYLYKNILELCYDKNNGLYYFCKFMIGGMLDIGFPKPFRYNNLLRKWDKSVKKHKHVSILCGRGHGKTVFFSEIYSIYDMFLYSYKRIIIVSASQEQANRILREIKTIIENNEWLNTKKDPSRWATETIGFNKGYILGTGIGGEILGEHVDRIVIDDILSGRTDKAISDEQIEDYIDMNMEPMLLNRDGQMLLVGCVNKNTRVLTKNGFVEICTLKKNNEKLETLNKNIYGLDGFHKATEIFDNGVKKTKIITTKYGYSLECTYNHPILAINENGNIIWKKTENISTDDYVAIQYGQNAFGNDDKLPIPEMCEKRQYKKHNLTKITKELAYLIGLYIAEGCITKDDITITNSELGNILENNDMGIIFKNRGDDIHYRYRGRYLIRQLKLLGIKQCKSYEKILPNIWKWKKELISEFIKGYADGDGCITGKEVKFTSTSKELLKQLQILLSNFGIVTSLRTNDKIKNTKHYIKKKRPVYDLAILTPFIKKYRQEIGFDLKRKQKRLDDLILNDDKIMYPNLEKLLRNTLKTVKHKSNVKKVNMIYQKTKHNLSRKNLKFFIKEFKREKADEKLIKKLEWFLNSNILFTKVKKIENSESHTMDFIIPNNHSFVSNGIISHNTPKRDTDYFHSIKNRIREGSNWVQYSFPAILDYEKKILQCPDRFTWKAIMDKRLTMGALKFAREYQLEIFSREKSLFPEHLLKRACDLGKDCVLLDVKDMRGNAWSFCSGIDVARSGSASADFSVCITFAYNPYTQTKQIVNMWRDKGLKISTQGVKIAHISKNFGFPFMLVEKNNMGQDMIDDLADKHNVNVGSFTTGGVGQKKEELIRFLITAFEHEQIIIPRGDEWSIKQTDILLDELKKFCVTSTPAGNEKYEGMGSKDDCVMSLAITNRATQEMGIPFAVTNSANTDARKGNFSEYESITASKKESDLVMMIRNGIIK